jgi:hypothetical protein
MPRANRRFLPCRPGTSLTAATEGSFKLFKSFNRFAPFKMFNETKAVQLLRLSKSGTDAVTALVRSLLD